MQHINVENVDMMKVNRILFSKLKQQYKILQMKSAYILAEDHLMQDPDTGVFTGTERIEVDDFKEFNPTQYRPKKTQILNLQHQIKGLEELSNALLGEEKYEEMQEAKEILDKLRIELKRIKNGI